MFQEKDSVWQSLMDEAYSLWQEKLEGVSYDEFVGKLDKLSRSAVLLGNLNYQVENGGFSQWHFNGYSKHVESLISVVKEIGTKSSLVVLKLLQDAKFAIDIAEPAPRSDWIDYEDEDEDGEGDLSWSLNPLDDKYYAVREQFMEDVENFLQSKRSAETLTAV